MPTSRRSVSVPIVSVVIPVRNAKSYIHEALTSALSQDIENIEVLIIDDGSNDFNYSDLQYLDQRVRVIRLPGYGVSRARNEGMAKSKGKFIAFLDADDVWFPNKLKAQLRYLDTHPEAGCVFGGFVKWYAVPSTGKFPEARSLWHDCNDLNESCPERSGWIFTRLLSGLLVGMNTAVIRREVFDLLGGFDESMRIGEDYMFWLKISRTFEMHSLAGPVALYRIHPSSAMNKLDPENHQARLLQIAIARWGLSNLDGTELSRAEFARRLAESHFTHAYNHFWHGSASVARHSFFKSIQGGVLPARSAAYIALSPFRRWLSSPSLTDD